MDFSRRVFLSSSFAAAGSVLLSGCGSKDVLDAGSASKVSTDAKHTVTVAMNTASEPAAGFDPLVAWGCGEHVHEPLIQSTLITTNDKLEFENDLATSYMCSTDGLTWTFEIRDDVVFSDGQPLRASDVAFTVNSIIKSDSSEADFSMVDEAVATSDTVVELHLNKPYNALLYTLAVLGIVPEHAYGKNYGKKPIGSGRYLLERWDRGQQAIFKANPRYYGKAPNMKRVVVVFMEEDAALAAVQKGDVDIAFTSATHSDQSYGGYKLVSYKTVDSRGISLPTIPSGSKKADGDNTYDAGNDVTCHLPVRRAINMAVDREALIKHVLNGYGKAAYSVGDGMPWSSDDMKVELDRKAAKKLLDDEGWKPGKDGIRKLDGTRASFELWYSSDDSVRQAIANEFADQMKKIGIEVNVKGGSWDQIYPHEFSQPILWGWGSNAPTETYELTYSKGWGNYACYDNAVIDAYLDQALAQQSVEESYPFWKKAQWDGTDGVAPRGAATWCWLVNVDHLYFKRDGLKVAKQKPHPHGHGWSLVNNVDAWGWA